jgi:hypothetical protein
MTPRGKTVLRWAGPPFGLLLVALLAGGAAAANRAPGTPDTTITSGPPGLTRDSTPTFTFSSSDPAATFQCSLDSAAFAGCASPYTTPPVNDAEHTLAVRAVDRAGFVDPSPATRTWTTDTHPPKLKVAVLRERLGAVRAGGLWVILQCTERCTGRSTLYRGKKAIGTGTVQLLGAGRKAFRVKLDRKANRALAHTKTVTLKLRTTAIDQVGNRSRPNTRKVRLRR